MSAWPSAEFPTRSLVAALLVAGFAPQAPVSDLPVATPVSPVVKSEKVTVPVVSEPTGAVVATTQRIEGQTPLRLSVDKGYDFDIRVQFPGYCSMTRRIVADTDKELLLVLASDDEPPHRPHKPRVKPRHDDAQHDNLYCLACMNF
jgi:hypothetical protein